MPLTMLLTKFPIFWIGSSKGDAGLGGSTRSSGTSPLSSCSMVMPNSRVRAISVCTSGSAAPVSHLETA